MPQTRPLLSDLITRTRDDVVSRLPQPDILRSSDAEVYSRVLAGTAHGLYGYIEWLSRQLIYDTAETSFLLRWASIWGIVRNSATAATGTVAFTGANGSPIPLNSTLSAYDGVIYKTTVDAMIASGTAVVPVVAVLTGLTGNRGAGQTLTTQATIAGVTATALASAMTGGAEIESDDSLRAKLLRRIQQPPHGGAKHDYETWALEVPGVTRAWVYPQEAGVGTVTVRFMMDDTYSNGIPLVGDVTTVTDHIEPVRPVTAVVYVGAPVAVPLNLTITGLSPATAAVQAAVTQEITDLIKREAIPGGTLFLSHLQEAISIAAGEYDHVLTIPAANVTNITGSISTMGTITWA